MWVSNITASYAPELSLKGTVAVAPGSEFTSFFSYTETTSTWPFLLMTAAGFNSAYGNGAAPLGEVLTGTGKKLVKTVIKSEPFCLASIFATLDSRYTYNQVFSGTTLPPAWQTLANENDPAGFTTAGPAPILIAQGSADTTVLPASSATLAAQLCALSPPQHLERWIYTGLDHNSVVGTQVPGTGNANGNLDAVWGSSDSIADIGQWMSDRFAGGSWPDPYVPTGNGATTVTQTNVC